MSVEERGMPESAENLWRRLQETVLLLHWRWKDFKQLYGGAEQVAILNATAPHFYIICKGVLVEDEGEREGCHCLRPGRFSFDTVRGQALKLPRRGGRNQRVHRRVSRLADGEGQGVHG